MKYNEEKLQQVYQYIVDFVTDKGFPPSVREICSKCLIKSTATVYLYIERLVELGLLVKSPNKKRSISLPQDKYSYKSIPIIGTITAGAPIFAVENLAGYLPLPSEFSSKKDCFALKVQGESMINAGILDKDIIIVQKQETAKNGDIVVALIEDSATVKRFYKKSNKIILHPENDSMQDMIFDNVTILGLVKGLVRKF